MTLRRIAAVLLLAQAVRADYKEDLEFARRLGARGLEDMALQILDTLEKSSDPAAARAGRYGKAVLEREQATLKRARFLRDLEDGVTPRVKREEVLAAFADAQPKIDDYVKNRPDDLDARFLLAELLQDYAEFLTGKDYPDAMAAQRDQLVTENAAEADKLFQAAIGHYAEVANRMKQSLGDKTADLTDPTFLRLTQAQYKGANALMRLALLYPKGHPKFNAYSGDAIEKLDEFFGDHFNDSFGAYAALDLGLISFERGLRGNRADAETGANYFKDLFMTVKEDEVPEVIPKALYWYARTCNALARGDGALGKPQPVQFDNTITVASQVKEKLKQGARSPYALKALLEVAEAYAAQNKLAEAVAVAGEALAGASATGQRQIQREATDRLTGWVSRVADIGALDAALLFKMGDALSAQGRPANAIAFYEKAYATASNDEEREKSGYPALARIAREYRKDKRNFAAAQVAERVVADFIKSKQGELSDFGVTAGEACNTERLAWKDISEETKRPQDAAEYQRVRDLFVKTFPGHPENSDREFANARDLYNKGQYEEAAKLLADISPASKGYWLAQRMVPGCYRQLATDEKDPAKAKAWHEKTLESAAAIVKLADAKGDDPQAVQSRQAADLFKALALASLERWPEALTTIDAYLARYPDPLLQRGGEFRIKIDAHLAQGQLAEAETALAAMLKRAPPGPPTRGAMYTVFKALRDAYAKMGAGPDRVATAGRAAVILDAWLEGQKDVGWDLKFLLGQVLFDADRFGDAADAYEAAVALAPSVEKKQQITLLAAEAKYLEAQRAKDVDRETRIKILEKVRDLFTDVLVPPDPKDPEKTAQRKIIAELASPAAYPKKETFGMLKRNPKALLVAARIYSESSPPGIDGRYLAIRLIAFLHEFTLPAPEPGKTNLDEFIPIWWDAAELKLRTYIAIAQSGTSAREKQAATDGLGYARKLGFEFPNMDSPARVAAVTALESQLKTLAR